MRRKKLAEIDGAAAVRVNVADHFKKRKKKKKLAEIDGAAAVRVNVADLVC
jgi:hypothetical protein